MNARVDIGGFVRPGLEAVREEFERNFVDRGEVGAAFTAYRGGDVLVDLWGGFADRAAKQAWARDTAAVVFSGSKGLVAVCLLKLIEWGVLELDVPVARYWPEFAAAGKEGVLVRDVVSHTAGLPGFRAPVSADDLLSSPRLTALLAEQAPLLAPGGAICYHALTYGWLCGELVRRIDGRTIGRFFAEEVAAPLALDVWIGLPEEFECRTATLEFDREWGESGLLHDVEHGGDELATAVWANPPVFGRDRLSWNSRAYHAAEIPGAGAIGTARSIARLYACLACDGELDGVALLSREAITRGRTECSRGRELIFGEEMAFGVGFALQTAERELGPPADAFGHGGAGGSIHGAWPTEGVGFSYVMNLMVDDEREADRRGLALLDALAATVVDEPSDKARDVQTEWGPD